MIRRIVKMTFRTEEISNFLVLFEQVHSHIKNREGCNEVKLYFDISSPNVIFTLSLWDNEESLESYRNSELFKGTWSKTKAMFSVKAEAWSLKEY